MIDDEPTPSTDSTPTPVSMLSYSHLRDLAISRSEAMSARARVLGQSGRRAEADACRRLSAQFHQLSRQFGRLPTVHGDVIHPRRQQLEEELRDCTEAMRLVE